MTPQEKKRLGDLIGMLDSDQVGEREAALGKVHALRAKVAWPGFADLWRRVDTAISPEDFEKVEQNVAQWKAAYDAKATENAALAARCAAFAAHGAVPRSALRIPGNRTKVVWAVLALAFGGLFWWHRPASPDANRRTGAPNAMTAADDSAFYNILHLTPWGFGDSAPQVFMIDGFPLWVMGRGTVDDSSLDARGEPIERHCLQIFALEAPPDGKAHPAPHTRGMGLLMQWAERASECRMPGERNYE